jgi:hypothetical protein
MPATSKAVDTTQAAAGTNRFTLQATVVFSSHVLFYLLLYPLHRLNIT